jgi:hypothetical protein
MPRVVDMGGAAVSGGHRVHEGRSQAGSVTGAAGLGAGEAVEDPRQELRQTFRAVYGRALYAPPRSDPDAVVRA